MLALSYARQGGEWLALASGAQREHLVGLEIAELLLVEVAEIFRQIAGVDRHLDHAVHGAADDDEVAARSLRRLCDGPDARDVRGERRYRHAALGTGDDAGERGRHLCLGRRVPCPEGVRRIADEGLNPLLAERPNPCLVGRRTDVGLAVELPVAGMEDVAERRADHDPRRLGDRVRHGNELEIEGPDFEAAAELDLIDGELQAAALLVELGAKHAGREARSIDRRPQPGPKIDDRADVVLMSVRDDDAIERRTLLLDEANIGQDDVHARLGIARERDAEVDHQPAARIGGAEAVEIAVHPDLAEAAQRHEDQLVPWRSVARIWLRVSHCARPGWLPPRFRG